MCSFKKPKYLFNRNVIWLDMLFFKKTFYYNIPCLISTVFQWYFWRYGGRTATSRYLLPERCSYRVLQTPHLRYGNIYLRRHGLPVVIISFLFSDIICLFLVSTSTIITD